MNTVAIVIARLGSTRLPGKVLMDLGGKPVLAWVVQAAQRARNVDEVWVATTTEERDSAIVQWCQQQNVPYYRGSETDVLARVTECAIAAKADIVVRLTADCCFLDPYVIDQVIQLRAQTGADYASCIDPPTFPDGLDTEAFTFDALNASHLEATRRSDRDCVTQFILRNRARFSVEALINPLPGGHRERFVLDTENDMRLCQEIARRLPVDWTGSHLDILRVLDQEPELRSINAHHPRNERFFEQIATEDRPEPKFDRSNALLQRARKVIPLGAQTFSKSYIQYPKDQAPLFVTHGRGGYVYDVDGQEYVDLVCGLLPIILGHNDPDVDEAVRRQLTNGISFSTSTALEAELAEMLCRLIPCAEMVRFGKNGTDVTTAAVRAARAFTGRPKILLSGYHGWNDWSIWTTERNLGVTEQRSNTIEYGNLHSLDIHDWRDTAAIIVEPNDDPVYLNRLRKYCDNYGIVLIFDEIITGFRYSLGGAQKVFGVTPDLATVGKAIANGMPLSAVVGRRDIMSKFEPPDNVFFSGTFMSETLSLAAGIACIKKLERENILTELALKGSDLAGKVRIILDNIGLDCISLDGHPTRKMFSFHGEHAAKVKTILIREFIRKGVLTVGSHNMCAAHGKPEMARVLQAWQHTAELLKEALSTNTIDKLLGATPIIGQVSVRAYR